MLSAILRAYSLPFLSAMLPRLALTAFTFSQPFLITATVTFFGAPSSPETTQYGKALVGAYLLVYLGSAVNTPDALALVSCL